MRELDRWAAVQGVRVIAQIGSCAYRPQAFVEVHDSLDERAYQAALQSCTHVVSHAGVGTILSTRDLGRPLLVVPRIAALGEHRSDHQRATARKLEGAQGVLVCEDLDEFDDAMDELLKLKSERSSSDCSSLLSLLGGLEEFVLRGDCPA